MTTSGLVVRIVAGVLFGGGSVASAVVNARKKSGVGIAASLAVGAGAAFVLARSWWP